MAHAKSAGDSAQHVDAAVPVGGVLDRCGDLGTVEQVGGSEVLALVLRPKPLLQSLSVKVEQHQRRPVLPEPGGDCLPQVAAGACHQNHLIPVVHRMFLQCVSMPPRGQRQRRRIEDKASGTCLAKNEKRKVKNGG